MVNSKQSSMQEAQQIPPEPHSESACKGQLSGSKETGVGGASYLSYLHDCNRNLHWLCLSCHEADV
jgi:hypothetical protein